MSEDYKKWLFSDEFIDDTETAYLAGLAKGRELEREEASALIEDLRRYCQQADRDIEQLKRNIRARGGEK